MGKALFQIHNESKFKVNLTICRFFFYQSGVSSMELVAMDMKLRGMYIARQLSFKGVTFTIDEVPLTDDFKRMYNDAVDLVSGYFG